MAAGFLVFMVGTPTAAVFGYVHPIVPPLVGFALLAIGAIVFVYDDTPTPKVPAYASQQGHRPVRLQCPSCGAALRSQDAKGIASCEYCRSRILVP